MPSRNFATIVGDRFNELSDISVALAREIDTGFVRFARSNRSVKLEPHITGRFLVRAHRAHSSCLFRKIVPTFRVRGSSEKKINL
jgi:hypothetical protein